MKFYDQVQCRVCKSKIKDCHCHPLPCPFCFEEFGFVQDWNIHLINEHHIEEPEIKVWKESDLDVFIGKVFKNLQKKGCRFCSSSLIELTLTQKIKHVREHVGLK